MTSLSPRVKRILLFVMGATFLLAMAIFVRRYEHRKEIARLIPQFKAAQVVPPIPKDPKDSSSPIRWKSTLQLSGNVSITLEALSFFGQASVTYSDESSPRIVALSEDYIWPQELRLDPVSQILFVRTSGLGGGIFPTTRIIEFDLKKRSRVTRITLDKIEVPQFS